MALPTLLGSLLDWLFQFCLGLLEIACCLILLGWTANLGRYKLVKSSLSLSGRRLAQPCLLD